MIYNNNIAIILLLWYNYFMILKERLKRVIETQTKIKKIGTSIGLIIPSHIVKILNIEAGQEVKLSVTDEKLITLEIKKPKRRRKQC